MRIHFAVMFYLFLLSGFFRLSRTEWVLIVLTVAFVMAMEIVNTSIETIVNLLSPNYDQLARIAKDASAGAVLVSAVASVAVGFLVLFDVEAFKRMFLYFSRNLWALALLLLSLVPACVFVFGGPAAIRGIFSRIFRRRRRRGGE